MLVEEQSLQYRFRESEQKSLLYQEKALEFVIQFRLFFLVRQGS
ncbi:hypothetical protein NMS_1584 [Nonlabens marinus S1-08]|uniref:Uncharacterized protein n=1 Tax=Nonlabens marinus S1-08 TaxID=1454201 RepID=W8VVM9_9FLAO|nr:hypothetical protein NMS_1584 [Nonlabens marinus S1-08]